MTNLVTSLLAATFDMQSGWGSTDSTPPPFFNLEINETQERVLQALVEYVFFIIGGKVERGRGDEGDW